MGFTEQLTHEIPINSVDLSQSELLLQATDFGSTFFSELSTQLSTEHSFVITH